MDRWLPNETGYSRGEFVAPNTRSGSLGSSGPFQPTPNYLHVAAPSKTAGLTALPLRHQRDTY